MSLARKRVRQDSNQKSIIEALEAVGVRVDIIGWPADLLCWCPKYMLIECKSEKGTETPGQKLYQHAIGDVPDYAIVRSPSEAIAAVQAFRGWDDQTIKKILKDLE